ncbi:MULTISPECIES: lipoyl(octanoyl) transferase LipB [unclassified Oceanobacter]|jgi:lipoyl(octanoyl) transferase|uniref:lipoyl(octanoyl) transferase LipB n=1 Tax=unclassified Oceanobacter TaxID=2620260 RepID=UPI002734956A|nr:MULTISPECIES: lipoyl(octanoyl) transferase LipB [unclassified Oceanobacter]MDP2506594.1 lipoyl(octanoyl) transferase LipB [Oceanobacter sp. 3_MG-2023]MDP2548959.1 lipoyl(octanoyl) transferase LipB [Oceanobacter sp. 4_MG-2023]MDP2609657.1 lipoyl(octanoyl) transferase LipB [Oceanobacter sp. 1_MG-2023]MDP2613375.1 lipoyl(octanoyl) transferase LipB [Oceanobacter sp. 2_MG-2023]
MPEVVVRQLGLVDYQPCYEEMVSFTARRQPETTDEIWFLQHPGVFTQGQAGKAEHVLVPGDIPVVQTDRGGQVTYHGPGQLVVYLLLDIKRLGLGPRALVTAMEESIAATLAQWGIDAAAKADAPGVYVDGRKIASLGLRIRNGRTFHGLALNVDMDMTPFLRINPCGYAGLEMTQVVREAPNAGLNIDQVAGQLEQQLIRHLGFTTITRPA